MIDDMVEATAGHGTPLDKTDVVRSVLRFIDAYHGIIFAIPGQCPLASMLTQRMWMNFTVSRDDLVLDQPCRERLWRRRISERFKDEACGCPEDLAVSLAHWEVTEDEIRGASDSVLAPGSNNKKPDWKVLARLLRRRLSLHEEQRKMIKYREN